MTFTNPALTDTASAITIATNISGPVILDLKGHTLNGSGGFSIGVGIGVFAGAPGSVSNTQPITIRNGTIRGFGFGVWAQNNLPLTDITVNHVAFFLSQTPAFNEVGVLFTKCNSSSVTNCTFANGENGIADGQSQGGNFYANDTFSNVFFCIKVTADNAFVPTVLNRCSFDGPPN
jgi:pectate lyase